MANARVIDVTSVVDEAKVTSFTIRVLVVAAFIMFLDGFDINNIGYVAPAIIKAWHLPSRAAMGPVFGASPFGILLGAPLLGYIGDRYGRKKAITIACLIFSLFTWAAVLTSTVTELAIVRFLCGIGIGGVMPNVIALGSEYAPKRNRGTLVVAMISGIGIGAGMPGPVAAWLVPAHGWKILFELGGIIGVLAAVLCVVALPESIKYYSVREGYRDKVIKLLRKVEPNLQLDSNTSFTVHDEKKYTSFRFVQLFQDGFAPVTVCLWILFAMNLMCYYFLFNWTPTLLSSANMPLSKAALFTSVIQVGGVIGGWTIGYLIDKFGYTPVAILPFVGIIVVGSIGYLVFYSASWLTVAMFLAGFTVLGFNYATNAVAGMVYPTAFRSNATGWCFAIGRAGSVTGPVLGGLLVGMNMSVQHLYVCAAIPYIIVAPVGVIFISLYRKKFLGAQAVASTSQAAAKG